MSSVVVPPAPGPHGADPSEREHLAYSPSSIKLATSDVAVPSALGLWSFNNTPTTVIFLTTIHTVRVKCLNSKTLFGCTTGSPKPVTTPTITPRAPAGTSFPTSCYSNCSREFTSSNSSNCCSCSKLCEEEDSAFACYQCVSASSLSLPVDKEVVDSGPSRGPFSVLAAIFATTGKTVLSQSYRL